ncbi:MAG: N-acetyltransferase [Novosphingobium sp.]|nr:N-acetyltransferase [Novosphingobium sp.]
MAAPFSITPAFPADAPEIADIYAHHVLHRVATFETVPPDTTEMAARMLKVADGGYPWITARDVGGTMLGYAYAGPFHPRAAYRPTCEDSVYLRHDRLGMGIGTALLSALITECEERGFRQMIALIAGTEPASVALHERAGFVHAGRLANVGRKFGKWLDVLYMQRPLGPGSDAPPMAEPQ